MKHLKLFEKYEYENHIRSLCEKYKIKNYSINDDGSIDVDGSVELSYFRNISKIPIKFNKVSRYFYCARMGLETLENSPIRVGSKFLCQENKLTTLLGGPKYVGGNYACQNNNLKDVQGFPEFYVGFSEENGPVGNKGWIYIEENPVNEIINLIFNKKEKEDYYNYDNKELNNRKYRFIKLLNEFNVIRNQNTVIESRLLDALSEMNHQAPEYIEFTNYKLI